MLFDKVIPTICEGPWSHSFAHQGSGRGALYRMDRLLNARFLSVERLDSGATAWAEASWPYQPLLVSELDHQSLHAETGRQGNWRTTS